MEFNFHIRTLRVKYEDLRTVMSMFSCKDYLFTFDFKSGYHHVDISANHWRYLGFSWNDRYYLFKVLPFGLSTACYLFTKLLRPLVHYWRSKGIRVVVYIDDGIVAAESFEQVLALADCVKHDLVRASLTINLIKSCFTPSKIADWLGFLLDFSAGIISVDEGKLAALIEHIQVLIANGPIVSARSLASVIGQVIAMGRAIGPLTRMFTRHLYAVVNTRQSWCSRVVLSAKVIEELRFWKVNIRKVNGCSMWFASSAVRVAYSDASSCAYGGYVVEHADKDGAWLVVGSREAAELDLERNGSCKESTSRHSSCYGWLMH